MKKKILITGGNGFLGKALIRKLKDYKNFQLIYPKKNEFNFFNLNDVKKIFKKYKNISYVVHLASDHGGLYYNIKNQGSIYYNNIIMNSHLMHLSMENKVKKFISAGTIDSYPKKAKFPLSENDFWDGYPEETSSAYAFSKKMMVVQGDAYKKQFNFKHIQLLFMNLYGPNDNFTESDCHVIPAIINKINFSIKKKNKSIKLFGNGKQKREFLYVDDAANSIIKTLNYNGSVNKINIGTSKPVTIKFLANEIKKLMNYDGMIKWNSKTETGIYKKNFNINLAKKILKFEPNTKLKDGLLKTISWYNENKN